jgi:hypothetical protein
MHQAVMRMPEQRQFLRVDGPGRCGTCSWHTKTQGHHLECPGGVETLGTLVPADGPYHWDDEATVALIEAAQAAERERQQLDPSQPYMRNAHLLPPREEFSDVDRYVRVLKLFEQAPATQVIFYRFRPTLAQRRANANVLAQWEAAQGKTRTSHHDSSYIQTAFDDEIEAVRTAVDGDLNTTLNTAGYNLGQLVGAGALDYDTVERELTDAALANGYPAWRLKREDLPGRAIHDGMKHPRNLSNVGNGHAPSKARR